MNKDLSINAQELKKEAAANVSAEVNTAEPNAEFSDLMSDKGFKEA